MYSFDSCAIVINHHTVSDIVFVIIKRIFSKNKGLVVHQVQYFWSL